MSNKNVSNCPVCGNEIIVDKELKNGNYAECCKCNIPHHRECYDYNGKCGIYGCDSTTPRCTYCSNPINLEDKTNHICPNCNTLKHKDCYNLKRDCDIYGCGNGNKTHSDCKALVQITDTIPVEYTPRKESLESVLASSETEIMAKYRSYYRDYFARIALHVGVVTFPISCAIGYLCDSPELFLGVLGTSLSSIGFVWGLYDKFYLTKIEQKQQELRERYQ